MHLLPFIRITEKAPGLDQFWLFLERNGTHLIEIDSAVENGIEYAKEFSATNGIPLAKEPVCIENIVYCEVAPDIASLSSFYTWKETPVGTTPTRELWRPFLWAVSPEGGDPWGVNSLMSSISLSESHSVYSVLSHTVKYQN